MAPNGSRKQKRKATARGTMLTSVMNRRLSLNRDRITGFILEHINRPRRIYNVCGVKKERAWDLLNNIIFLDPVTTRHISQFQLMWPHRRSRSPSFREWLAAFGSYIPQMFHKSREQMNNRRWDNPRAFGDQVDHPNPQTISWGTVKRTDKYFTWYGCDDPRAILEPPSCRQYKPANFLATGPLNWDVLINDDDDDENWADLGAPSVGQSCPGNDNENDKGDGE